MKAIKFLVICFLLISCAAQTSEAQTVYVTKTGQKYHRGSCQYLRKSQRAISIKDAVSQGYTPCSVCQPGSPPQEKKQSQNSETKVKDVKDSTSTSKPAVREKSSSEAVSRQCSATTQAGSRCKRMTTNSNGKCYQHQ